MPPAVTLVRDRADELAAQPPVRWALGELERALEARGVRVEELWHLQEAPAGASCVLVAGSTSSLARTLLGAAGRNVPQEAEAFTLVAGRPDGREALLASGADARGLVYALLELADRVTCAGDPLAALQLDEPVAERPANRMRSVMRLFASDVEDMSWFRDVGTAPPKTFWRRYLTMLAGQRFNRFNLALGLGYDFPRGVRDSYLYFSYPFLVDVPGYDVRASGVSDEERARNLASLRAIGEETVARGLHFQLGLWTHAYELQESPDANHTIVGLTPDIHAAYCRDALRTLLQAVPSIGGVTIRIHGESGIPERSYDFWRTVFQGAAECGRRVELDLHTKGIDQRMIDVAVDTGLPVVVSPKYWAEHLGLPYHQAWIRPTEQSLRAGNWEQSFMALSAGERRFTRYGYADLLREDRGYDVLWRVWPGTQRLLLWGDPVFAAAYGRAASFAGTGGLEFFDPLAFKGRKGSGLPGLHGHRGGYADESLLPQKGDWAKYTYTYRLWGRGLYDPDTVQEPSERWLRHTFKAAGDEAGEALAHASRLLPLVTTAHLPSAANYGYWAELPTNMPIVDERRPHPYRDTPDPKRFGAVSPLDPQLFTTGDECAAALAEGHVDARYSTLEVAAWLDDLAGAALHSIEQAETATTPSGNGAGELRRWALDVRIQAGVGRYYAAKLRAGVTWSLFERTASVAILRDGLDSYRRAREAWAQAAACVEGTYAPDLTFGPVPYLRGHWSDRLEAIDADIADMAGALDRSSASGPAERSAGTGTSGATTAEQDGAVIGRWRATLNDPSGHRRHLPSVTHSPPASFTPGKPLAVECTLGSASAGREPPSSDVAVTLHYRHVNQAEPWQTLTMERGGDASSPSHAYRAVIPAGYTDSPYPLQYYFELRSAAGATLWPGFAPDLANQPYVLICR